MFKGNKYVGLGTSMVSEWAFKKVYETERINF
jgi:hypothetical protein